MTQRFYQKASVQVAIVSAIGLIVAALITVGHQRSQLKSENKKLEGEVTDKTAEIQRLETLLTPFRTIAIQKYTGDEAQSLRKLADYVVKLQERDAEQAKRIGELQKQVEQTKQMYGPPTLVPLAKEIKKTNSGYEAIVQFKPSNNSRVDGYTFNAKVIEGDMSIVSFGGSSDHHAFAGGPGKVSDDKKSAEAHFNPLAGNPTIKIVVTTNGVVELTGSHLDRSWRLEID